MKVIITALIFLLLFPTLVLAGTLTMGARAGLYSPPEAGASPSLMYGVTANYDVSEYLLLRGAAENTSYSVGSNSYTLTPITIDAILHTHLGSLTPYAGAGVGYYTRTVNGVSSSTTGVQAETGLKFTIGNVDSGFEIRYLLPDTANTASGSMSYNGYVTGGFSTTF